LNRSGLIAGVNGGFYATENVSVLDVFAGCQLVKNTEALGSARLGF